MLKNNRIGLWSVFCFLIYSSFLVANYRPMTEELSAIKNNCHYGRGNEGAFNKALVAEMKKSGNQWPSSGWRRDSSEFVVRRSKTVTFHRYCFVIAQDAIVCLINNFWVIKIPNCIFSIVSSILSNLIVISIKR